MKNYSVGYWEDGEFVCYSEGATNFAEAKVLRDSLNSQEECTHKVIIIVLTTAHLNPDPMDCRDQNLAMLCQNHHLQLDRYLHSKNARATRLRKQHIGQLELFSAA